MVAEIEQKQSFRVFESELQIKLNDCLPFSCSSALQLVQHHVHCVLMSQILEHHQSSWLPVC